MKYFVKGAMRESGALGVTYRDSLNVEAPDWTWAVLALYKTREHVSGGTTFTNTETGETSTLSNIIDRGA